MARIYGLNGLIQGRQGNNVFSIQNGTQVLKKYNPSVANPRTEAQQTQRVKFALAGKISGCTPHDALVGLVGASKRARRASFVSSLVRAAVPSVVTGTYSAEIPFTSIIFSRGALPRWGSPFVITAEYEGTRNIQVTVPAMTVVAGAPSGYGELVVIGLFDGSASPLDDMQVIVHDRTAASTVTFRENFQISGVIVSWVIPYVTTSRENGLNVSNLYPNTDNNGVRVATSPLSLMSNAEFGQSVVNYQVLVNPTQNMAGSPSDGDDANRSVAKKK